MFSSVLTKINSFPEGYTGAQARIMTTMRLGLPVGLISHIGFLIQFWFLGFPELALINLFSIAIFLIGNWQLFRNKLRWPLYSCVVFELPVHAILATIYLGVESGFWLFVFISVAVILLYPTLTRPVRFAIGIGMTLVVGVAALFTIENGSVYSVSNSLTSVFLLVNLLVLALVVMLVMASYDLAVEVAERAQQVEFERAESLLLNILPARIAGRLKVQEESLADNHDGVSVLFADIAGFTTLSRNLSAQELVTLLNDLFTRFDDIAERIGAEKIKTIGDSYMVAAGLTGEVDHAVRIVDLAIAMQSAFSDFRQTHNLELQLRIGVHSGTVVAGVIGKQKFAYDLWGDTVNVASRMESTGVADRIQISAETRALLPARYSVESRGDIQIKGHHSRECFLLKY